MKVTNVEIKQVDLDHSMVRAIARQAEAERPRRAKVINAEGEQQAAQKLVEAAEILATSPRAMQLRYLGNPERDRQRAEFDNSVSLPARRDPDPSDNRWRYFIAGLGR